MELELLIAKINQIDVEILNLNQFENSYPLESVAYHQDYNDR